MAKSFLDTLKEQTVEGPAIFDVPVFKSVWLEPHDQSEPPIEAWVREDRLAWHGWELPRLDQLESSWSKSLWRVVEWESLK